MTLLNLNYQKIPKYNVPPMPHWPQFTEQERDQLKTRIRELLITEQALLVAHYYTDGELQALAEETGGCVADSLEMARFGAASTAKTLVVCGVRFMGETAKILNPEKKILMPDLRATCSLDEGCPADEFTDFCDKNPDHQVVVYANTSAAVKARADWMVTSSIALPIVKYLLNQGEKILWAPDKHLGRYIERKTGAKLLLWEGACIVHEGFKAFALEQVRNLHPDAAVLVHPEAPADVIDQADLVGSTTQLIKAVVELTNTTFIIATDAGILWKMRQLAPNKILIPAPTAGEGATCESCAHCPWMAMNSLQNLEETLKNKDQEIFIDPYLSARAKIPIERMLKFAAKNY